MRTEDRENYSRGAMILLVFCMFMTVAAAVGGYWWGYAHGIQSEHERLQAEASTHGR